MARHSSPRLGAGVAGRDGPGAAGPGDPGARRAARRAGLPHGRQRDRRPPGDGAARGARHRLRGDAQRRLPVHLPRARHHGGRRPAGRGRRPARAYALGVDGIWLAVPIGVGLGGRRNLVLAPVLVDLLGASGPRHAVRLTYLRISLLGLPAMLVVLAATGALRGLKDTRTPLLATGLAAVANIPLNLVLVYPLGLGVAGSALGTVLAQAGSRRLAGARSWSAAPAGTAAPAATRPAGHPGGGQRERASARPHRAPAHLPADMTFVAAAQGDVALASHQIAFTLWYLLAMPPEAFAIASQAMVGHALGAGGPGGGEGRESPGARVGPRQRAGDGRASPRPAAGVHPDLHHRPRGPRPRLVARRRGRRQPAGRCAALRPRRDPHRRRRHALSRLGDAGRRS